MEKQNLNTSKLKLKKVTILHLSQAKTQFLFGGDSENCDSKQPEKCTIISAIPNCNGTYQVPTTTIDPRLPFTIPKR